MDFKMVLDKLSVLRKFHTCNEKNRIVFYRGVDNLDGLLRFKLYVDDDKVFDLSRIVLMSVSHFDGVLVHYDTPSGRCLYPFRYNDIEDVIVELK